MSKPRLQMTAVIDTEAHADTIISNIRAELVGKDIFEEHGLGRSLNELGQVQLILDFRFNNAVDRDSIKTWIRDQVRDHPIVKTWVLSVKLTTHLCTHDDSDVKDCTTTDYVMEFQR